MGQAGWHPIKETAEIPEGIHITQILHLPNNRLVKEGVRSQ